MTKTYNIYCRRCQERVFNDLADYGTAESIKRKVRIDKDGRLVHRACGKRVREGPPSHKSQEVKGIYPDKERDVELKAPLILLNS